MGDDLVSWRAAIGLYYTKRQRTLRKSSFHLHITNPLYSIVWCIITRMHFLFRNLVFFAQWSILRMNTAFVIIVLLSNLSESMLHGNHFTPNLPSVYNAKNIQATVTQSIYALS